MSGRWAKVGKGVVAWESEERGGAAVKGLSEMTPDELGEFIDSHLITALVAADMLANIRQGAEDYLRDRLVWASDSWPESKALRDEDSRRRKARLIAAISEGAEKEPPWQPLANALREEEGVEVTERKSDA